MKEIKLELLKEVVNQIKLDSEYGDFTAIEELFLKLENPEEQLKGFLADDLDRKSTRLNSSHVRTSRMPSSA